LGTTLTSLRNNTGFDLWEEVQGSSFFTIAASHRALVEGNALAKALGFACPGCSTVAPHVLCFMQRFWSPSGYVISNLVNYRNGRDANSILASIHTFDPTVGCDANTFQPCSDKALSNHKQVVDSFRSIYRINSGIAQGKAVAIGRYSEDVYYNGNPWYLTTLAASEQLYDALYVWRRQGSITVTSTSLAFFRDLVPGINAGTYSSSSSTFTSIVNAVSTYADGFVQIVADRAKADGSMPEQFDRNTGAPLAAADLTWSYAAFLSAAARRAGVVPSSWNAQEATLPGTCQPQAVVGSYTSATATNFPANQTPVRTTTGTFPTPTGCPVDHQVLINFSVRYATAWGQSIKLVGNIPALGNWNPSRAPTLGTSSYSSSNPLWSSTVALPQGVNVQYKYVMVDANGAVRWEVDPNRSFTVPSGCVQTGSARTDTWQG